MPTKLMLEFSVNTCTNIFINSHKTSLTPSQLIPFYCFKRVFKAKLSVKKFLLLTVKCFLFTYIEVFKDAFVFCCFRLKLISFLGSLFITLALSKLINPAGVSIWNVSLLSHICWEFFFRFFQEKRKEQFKSMLD